MSFRPLQMKYRILHNFLYRAMVLSLTNPLEKDRNKMTEKILNLTLEIIYLLTGEDYTLVKKTLTSSEIKRSGCLPYVSLEWSRTQTPIMMTTNHSLTHEKKNEQKILELTNKIIGLLTGEVPIRCQDVAVYFSMGEFEYLEGHKDLYKDVMIENQQTLTSPGKRDLYKDVMMEDHQTLTSPVGYCKRNSPERCPSPVYSDCPQENHYVPLDHESEDLINIKVKVLEEEDLYMKVDHQYKEEEIAVDISPADDCAEQLQEYPLSPDYEAELKDMPHTTSSDLSNYKETLFEHLQTVKQNKGHKEDKIYQCYECGKHYKNAFNLYIHKRIHRDERPFSCMECGKCFTKKSVLVEHLRVHTGEKPYACSECGKSFTKKSILVEHQRIHTGDKPFLCSECGRCFARKSHLERHLRTHTGEKPFSCSKCEKGFIQKIHLIEHQRIHTEDKPFTCPECGKRFIQKSHLVKHQKTHTAKKPSERSDC
ncbi:uncharacterized protein LOC142663716 isoform X3 [Rhinoderma darwinii]|uniref:uncharacterized protein LOC142663716 isoform X3 n=1 Tax=Rhinoderma darwinii TaxID=43563 RepID=UPI003F67C01C